VAHADESSGALDALAASSSPTGEPES
jgi:hypothetical protein